MSLLPANTDYSDKDFDSIRARLIALVFSVFPEWTDFNKANFGNILLELFSHAVDLLFYYQDKQAAEAFITSATLRKSLLAHAKLLGYQVPGASAATADVTVSLPTTAVGDVTIPTETVCSTQGTAEPVKFRVTTGGVITAGGTQVVVTVKQSETQQDTAESTELPNQEVILGSTPYLDDSTTIVAANGTFTEVANFLDSTSSDKHFTVTVDQNDRATVRFGNGSNGVIPTGSIVIDYETGGGAIGNVAAGTIVKLEGSWSDSLGNSVYPSITNADNASGGADRETNAAIKKDMPGTVQAPVNSVSRSDFQTNIERLASVSRCLFVTSNESDAVPENTGHIYLIPEGGGQPSSQVKADAVDQVTTVYPKQCTFNVVVYDTQYLEVNVQATVYLVKGVTEATVRTRIQAALESFFAIENDDGTQNTNIDFGANIVDNDGNVISQLAWSDVHNAVRDVVGVRKVDAAVGGFLLNAEQADATLEHNEFPTLGTVILYNGDTGGVF